MLYKLYEHYAKVLALHLEISIYITGLIYIIAMATIVTDKTAYQSLTIVFD